MPKVAKCDVADCSYNESLVCHALPITVGGNHPACDTYLRVTGKGGSSEAVGSIGACKERDCRYNELLECTAPSIDVGQHRDHADCMTFSKDRNLGLP